MFAAIKSLLFPRALNFSSEFPSGTPLESTVAEASSEAKDEACYEYWTPKLIGWNELRENWL